jgi:hypothetical protein
MQARVASSNKAAHVGGLGPEQLQLLEQRIEARLALLATQYVTIEALREWEIRYARGCAMCLSVLEWGIILYEYTYIHGLVFTP